MCFFTTNTTLLFIFKKVKKHIANDKKKEYNTVKGSEFMAGKYEIDMCNGSLFPKIIKCALPLMAANLLQLLYNAVDIIVVGRYVGESALAAVGSTSSLISLIVNAFIGFSVGTSVVVAQNIGSKDYDKVSDACHTSVLFSVLTGVFLVVIGTIICRPLLILMGSPENVIDQATLYMKIYFLGMPAFMFTTYGSALMRTVGDTKRPLYYFSISGILNVVLNLIMVLCFNMGVAGVAGATIISQYVSAAFILIALTRNDGYIKIYLSDLRIEKDSLLSIIKKGLPVGLQSIVFGTSNVIIQSSVNSFGSAVMAGSSAAANIEGFLYTAQNTFCHVATSFVGQNFGAKNYKRIDKILLICMSVVFVIGLTLGTLVYIFGNNLLSIYAPGNLEAIFYGMVRIRYIELMYFSCGIMDVFVGTIRGIGSSVTPMITSILGVCGIRILWIFTVFKQNKTLETLFISYPISWVATTLILMVAYLIIRKKYFKKEVLQ